MIDIQLLANKSNIKKYDSSSIIIDENSKDCDEMFILLIGKVNIIKNYNLPNEVTLETITPGNIFGEMNFFCEGPSDTTAIATEDTTVASITKKNYFNIAKKNNDLFIQLMEVLSERVVKAQNNYKLINSEKIRIFKEYNIDENAFYKSLLFPKEHVTYSIIRPEEFENYIYPQTYTCPYCNQTFQGFTPLSSKLVLKGDLSCNMRRIYQSFDPIWYEVLTCPHCYFSALESGFNSEEKLKKELIADQLDLIKLELNLNLEEPRDIEQVFASHYLALICSNGYEKKKQIDAKLWLSISWLYSDVNDVEMERFAVEKALEYTDIYYSECDLSPEARQVALMILGTLARKLNNYNDSILYLSKAITVPTGKSVYKRLIELEIDEIREEKNKNK